MFTTPQECAVKESLLTSFNIRNARLGINSDKKCAFVNINTAAKDLGTIYSFSNTPATFDIEIGVRTSAAISGSTSISSFGSVYLHCCLQRTYPGLLHCQKYEEISESSLNVLNQDR